MSATILNGRKLAAKIKDDLKAEVATLKDREGQVPHFVNLLTGSNPSALAYANSQKRVAEYIGIDYELRTLPEDISQDGLIAYIKDLNVDRRVHGIMIHKPVPEHIEYSLLANTIDPKKDLEGINVANIGKMILSQTNIFPCTPEAVMEHVRSTGVALRGKEVVIVGHSEIVGKPLALLMLNELATVTLCHVGTSEAGKLPEHVHRADIVVVAVGRPNVVKGEWIRPGAIVVDVGINEVDGKIVGDVEFEKASARAAFITPVPGGVGPVTVVMLMRNGVETFKKQIKIHHE